MRYNEVVGEIVRLVERSTSFVDAGTYLERALNNCSREDILAHLDYGGVIPEQFNHDSTEEKIFAKYCDALLARSLKELGLDAEVLESRGNSADVGGRHPNGSYTMVGDAKAFRLSRTAKNQKDFKVEALNEWRAGADYACLLAPIYQFPNSQSQIYGQAIRYNVTLLTYTHFAFMIRSGRVDADKFLELLTIGSSLRERHKVDVTKKKIEPRSATEYWNAIHDTVLKITGKEDADWRDALRDNLDRLKEQAKTEIGFWQERKTWYQSLDHDTAVRELIKALKIDSKIGVIKDTGKL